MKEMEQMQKAMDEFFEYLDKDVFNTEELKRKDEQARENIERKKEGLKPL